MGLYDTVRLYEDAYFPEYPEGVESPAAVAWQTKGIDHPCMTTYRIMAGGELLEEEVHTETVPPEERPYASRDDVDEDDFRYMCGALKRVHDGWIERDNYHGRFQITHSFQQIDSLVTYEVTFTHGKLEGFERIQ